MKLTINGTPMTKNHILSGTTVILGNFDGVHNGHRSLIEKARLISGGKTVIFTFEPHPTFVVQGKKPVDLIYTALEKKRIFIQDGIDYYVEMAFTLVESQMAPEDFIKDVLVAYLKPSHIVIGSDYRFGKARKGDSQMLKEYGRQYGYDVIILDKLEYDHHVISSSYIRETIKEGNMELANRLLGRPFSVTGIVMEGEKIGRTIGYPTANLIPEESKLLPPLGVYVSDVLLRGETYRGITNIGSNPTVMGNKLTVETYILDFDQEIYGKEIMVSLYHFIRKEEKFDSLETLKEQIYQDLIKASEYTI